MTESDPFEAVNIKIDPDLVDHFEDEFEEKCYNLIEIKNEDNLLEENGVGTKLEQADSEPEIYYVSDDEDAETNVQCKHKCSECNKSFKLKKNLKTHRLQHKGLQRSCKICSRNFKDFCDLKKHILKKHANCDESGNFKCQCCGDELPGYEMYWSHYQSHIAENGKFVCLICDKSYLRKDKLQRHYRYHNVCHLCQHKFLSQSGLYLHFHKVHGGKRFVPMTPILRRVDQQENPQGDVKNSMVRTEIASEEVQIKTEDAHPVQTQYKEPTHQSMEGACKFCSFVSEDYDCLVRHTQEIHYGEEVYFCDVCRKIYKPGDNSCNHIEIYDINASENVLTSGSDPLMLCLNLFSHNM